MRLLMQQFNTSRSLCLCSRNHMAGTVTLVLIMSHRYRYESIKHTHSLFYFIKGLAHLEPIHYRFHVQKNDDAACCLCSCARCLILWRTNYAIDLEDEGVCKNTLFKSNGLLQHNDNTVNDFHLCTAYYLWQLYSTSGWSPQHWLAANHGQCTTCAELQFAVTTSGEQYHINQGLRTG